jgi:exosortase/archaeosortase family protein
LALAVLLVLLCYPVSLWTLLRGVGVDTPLAHLGLVPIVAVALMLALARPRPGEPEIHDRHVDMIVGVPLIAVAVTCLVLLPPRMSTLYWLWRIDLLTMPLFVAGVIALLFGTRMLWRVRAGVLFLFLAWPVPFRWLVSTSLDPLTERTAAVVALALKVLPVASQVDGDAVAFSIPHAAGAFRVQVASACSGANSLLGFLLVAGALVLVLRGSRTAKLAWLATGAALVLVLNVVRILAIITVGRYFGETASIDVLHPYVGLVSFSVGVFVMVLLSARFGLELPPRRGPDRTAATLRAVPRVAPAVLVALLVTSVVGGAFDRQLLRYDPIASSVGTPRLATFSKVATRTPGYFAEPVASLDEGKRFFGQDSSWIRYSYAGLGVDGLRTNVPVLADVINSSDLQSFSDFGLEACYRFHGYGPQGVRRVDLGNGVVGTVLGWTETEREVRWTGVYWIWPVRAGEAVRYERVVMMLSDSQAARLEAPRVTERNATQFAITADEVVRGASSSSFDQRELDRRAFLVEFSRRVVDAATERAALIPSPKELGG